MFKYIVIGTIFAFIVLKPDTALHVAGKGIAFIHLTGKSLMESWEKSDIKTVVK